MGRVAKLVRPDSKIGIVGWGRMGSAIGGRLLAAGWEVYTADVDPASREAADLSGAVVVATAKEVAAEVDLVFVTVVDDQQVHDVVTGTSGILSGLSRDCIVSISASVSPQLCMDLADVVAKQGGTLIDAPIVGGEHGAATASLLVLCGGDRVVVDACSDVFSTFATSVAHVGDVGTGQIAKMVNNIILFACIRIDYEALSLAKRLGVEPGILRPIIGAGSGANRALSDWAFHNTGQLGDRGLRGMVDIAENVGVELPLVTELARILEQHDMDLDELR